VLVEKRRVVSINRRQGALRKLEGMSIFGKGGGGTRKEASREGGHLINWKKGDFREKNGWE